MAKEQREPVDYVVLEDELYEMSPAARQAVLDMMLDRNEGKIKPGHLRLRTLALDIAIIFDKMSRVKTADVGEGSVVVMISDKLVRKLSAVLRAAAKADD